MLAALLGQVRETDREQRRDRGNKLYQDGRKAYEAARLDVAEPLFRKAIEIIPEFPEPHLALAHVLARLGRAAEAEASLAESKRRLPDSYQPASPTEHEAAMARRLEIFQRVRGVDIFPQKGEDPCHDWAGSKPHAAEERRVAAVAAAVPESPRAAEVAAISEELKELGF